MSFQESAGRVLPQYVAPSVCEACGREFTCGAALAGCWCQEIKLSEEARSRLRARYERCLCRACLENYAEGEKDGEKEEQVPTGEAH
ncbi:MAG TPA: cysteine-rich CWC family protein [Pyrinomonadaceae bacterium]|nr:cysteine-rich CWC family protein [Pyrinomonadaceae bacterium]